MRSAPPAGRPVLVYLHSELHADASEFLRSGLCTAEVSAALAAVGFVVWGGAVHEPSGWEAALRLEAAAFPFLGVYTPTAAGAAFAFTRVWALEGGPLPAGAELAAVLRHVGGSARAASTRVAAARGAADMERQLREQQERCVGCAIVTRTIAHTLSHTPTHTYTHARPAPAGSTRRRSKRTRRSRGP